MSILGRIFGEQEEDQEFGEQEFDDIVKEFVKLENSQKYKKPKDTRPIHIIAKQGRKKFLR